MGRFLDTPIPHASRARSFFALRCRNSVLATRILLILLLLALLHEQHLYTLYRRELTAKYSSTTFNTSDFELWRTPMADPDIPRDLLTHRKEWKVLGSGWEGNTFSFNGTVIKTFTPGRSPFRNCALGHPSERWPTEIPASLEFGGIWRPEDDSYSSTTSTSTSNETIPGFLPVKAHFVSATSTRDLSEWYLVTPLLPGGNLYSLAKRLKTQHPFRLFRDIDSIYRPTFHQLLRTLDSLHAKGFCHDDVKPSNIFVESDINWIIGDLGNVRQVCHPYHSSRLWIKDNNQIPDCRANDVHRLLKSYLQFVRAASSDTESFDVAFFDGEDPLSRLFWWTSEDALTMSGEKLISRSEIEDPLDHGQGRPYHHKGRPQVSLLRVGRRKALSRAVDVALQTKFSETAARWAAMTWIFGVPVESC